MKLLSASIGLWLAAVIFVSAELGQNELKVAETYGPPKSAQKISDNLIVRQYDFNGLSISVAFLNGNSQCETFQKTDGAPLSDDQIGKILDANANRLVWAPQAPAAANRREWKIAGPKPSAPEKADDPLVFAVSGRQPAAMGAGRQNEKQIAVDVLDTADGSSTAPLAPTVLRRAVYKQAKTNSVLTIFTAAYEKVAKPAPAAK